jgi:molybdopterin biosynthesis enzyme
MAILEVIGSFAPVDSGARTVVAADDTAGTLTIPTKLSSITTVIVNILRAGDDVKDDAAVTFSGGVITVADGGATYALTAGDVIHYIAIGTAKL